MTRPKRIRIINSVKFIIDNVFQYRIVDKLHDSMMNVDWRRVDRSSLGNCNYNFNQYGLYTAEVQIGLSDGVIHQE